MNLADVAGELAQALGGIPGLHLPEWGVQRGEPPYALIPLPDRVDYDGTYERGSDRIEDWPVLVLVPRPTEPETRRDIAEYAAGSGSKSVKQAIEAYPFTAADDVRVAWSEFDVVAYAGVNYLAAMFHLEIVGRGA